MSFRFTGSPVRLLAGAADAATADAARLLREEQMRANANTGVQRPHIPPPTSFPDPDPGASRAAPILSTSDISVLRIRLPNLADLSDDFFRTTSLADLTALQNISGSSNPIPVATTASGDHAKQMSASLALLPSRPLALPAASDDRLTVLHPARFLGGPVCDAGQLWLAARAAISATPITPLASYDMEKIGLSGCVTARGWFELHDPASTSLSLKLFSSANVGNTTSANKRLTLADTDGVINVGDSLQEISDMADFQTALRAVSKAAAFAVPWNHSFNAIEGFLHATNFCAAELSSRPNRAALLTSFVNHVFGINAKKWSSGVVFLGADELRACWLAFFGTRSASALASDGSGSGSRPNSYNNNYGSNNSNKGPGNNNNNNKGSNNSGGGGGGGQQPVSLCRRYNAGVCPYQRDARCTVPGTSIRLLHLCDRTNQSGAVCRRQHPNKDH